MNKKNNKGFTLVEVIAVVALLGILMFLAVPRIYSLVTDSRKNIYIQDAIRLITQAQYTMNSKSARIEKPDEGQCIIFSMKYLSVSDFQNPPNGGAYMPESSFVIVKNDGNEFVYSTMLVEKTKGGDLIGVELTTESALNAKNAIKHVRNFTSTEIAYIDENSSNVSGGEQISAAYINRFLNPDGTPSDDWIEDDDQIIGYYNNEREEEEIVVDTSSPKISAKFSTSGSLQTTLNISATDPDNDKSDLKVCVKISKLANDTYPDPTKTADAGYCSPYGENSFYTKDIDFSRPENGGFTYSSKDSAYIYIAVSDPNNNITRKRMTYDIRQNEEPKITYFEVLKQPDDRYNMPRSRVMLSLSDDMDNQENLQVCFLQDDEYGECTNFKPYSYYFGSSNAYNYTFRDSNGTAISIPDGSGHTLKVFVKDSMNASVSKTATYTIYQNQPPSFSIDHLITDCVLKDEFGNCNCIGCHSLRIGLDTFVADDDITPYGDLKLRFYEKVNNEEVGVLSMTYSQFMNSNKLFVFHGYYDGIDRKLYVDVTDEYGAKRTKDFTLMNVYRDQSPTIRLLKDDMGRDIAIIRSAENPCSGASYCEDATTYGGSYHTRLSFDVSDDLSSSDILKVCVSENQDDCTADKLTTTSNFVRFNDMDKDYTFVARDVTPGNEYPSPALEKQLYISVADDRGNVGFYSQPIRYKLYKNHGPKFLGTFSVHTTDSNPDLHLSTVYVNTDNLTIEDDFNNYQVRFCYHLSGESGPLCTSFMSYSDLKTELSSAFEFKNREGNSIQYNIPSVSTFFEVKDNYGVAAETDPVVYEFHQDGGPIILGSELKSNQAPDYNSYILNISFKVQDDQDTYSVCVSNTSTCESGNFILNSDDLPFSGSKNSDDDYNTYSIIVNAHETLQWRDDYQDNGTPRDVYLIVKDSYGHTTTKKFEGYVMYEICSNPDNIEDIGDTPTYVPVGEAISPSYCEGACYRSFETTTDHNQINYMTGTNDRFGNYKKTLNYRDRLVMLNCGITTDEKLYCDNAACFDTFSMAQENPNVIGLKLYEPDIVWSYSNTAITNNVKIYKPYCENMDSGIYFHPNDARCPNYVSFCGEKASAHCVPIIDEEEAAVNERNAQKEKDYRMRAELYELEKEEALRQYLIAKFSTEGDPETPEGSNPWDPWDELSEGEQGKIREFLQGLGYSEEEIEEIISHNRELTIADSDAYDNWLLERADRLNSFVDFLKALGYSDSEIANLFTSHTSLTQDDFARYQAWLDSKIHLYETLTGYLASIGYTSNEIDNMLLTQRDLLDDDFDLFDAWVEDQITSGETSQFVQLFELLGYTNSEINAFIGGTREITDVEHKAFEAWFKESVGDLAYVRSVLFEFGYSDEQSLDILARHHTITSDDYNMYQVWLFWQLDIYAEDYFAGNTGSGGDTYPFDMIETINVCLPLQLHLGDSEWLTTKENECSEYNSCVNCFGENPPTQPVGFCNRYSSLSDCNAIAPSTPHEIAVCDAFRRYHDCVDPDRLDMYISEYRNNFLTAYNANHIPPVEPVYEEYDREANLSTCVNNYKTTCEGFYRPFCQPDTPLTTFKRVVNCDNNPDITPVYCQTNGMENGYCLESDTSCTYTDDQGILQINENCHAVCYKDFDCKDEYVTKPITFLCHGYFKTYRATEFQGNVRLEEQEFRVCPDFYRMFPKYFAFSDTSSTPFIRFNPDQVKERTGD